MEGGEAHALKGPEFAVKGATDFDQRWIDETTEAGVAALGWPRPAARPPEWDKPLARSRPTIEQAAAAPTASPPVVKKKRRLRDKVLHPFSKGDGVEGG